ncbi:BTB/POZ domain-containing adapter for CUL3-mediated RhoA degradation protein 3-like [Tachypleus tridentatus]|uniref:BTB/POZ domain-containing adapter for CUL3-mediated RhoA degradation protein 3-like n=1 Tax=Tachypleus tridentatus TaxID=6853 RepID=UPI003FD22E75
MTEDQKVSKNSKDSPVKYVKLNVGGSPFYTTMSTLTKHACLLRDMFSEEGNVFTDPQGWVMIDRCGKHFGTVLAFLQDGCVSLLDKSLQEVSELLAEARYYHLPGLVEQCELALQRQALVEEPICRIPLITSTREEQQLVTQSTKPVIKLLINRHNNKYSYTSMSDGNLLKNLEFFDELSLKFSKWALFVKDVLGSGEICQWSFYEHGGKIAGQLCCTSVVYANGKKHTKVTFDQSRIYTEVCVLLLRENPTDQEVCQATGFKAPTVSTIVTSEEEDEHPSNRDGRESGHLRRMYSTRQTS